MDIPYYPLAVNRYRHDNYLSGLVWRWHGESKNIRMDGGN